MLKKQILNSAVIFTLSLMSTSVFAIGGGQVVPSSNFEVFVKTYFNSNDGEMKLSPEKDMGGLYIGDYFDELNDQERACFKKDMDLIQDWMASHPQNLPENVRFNFMRPRAFLHELNPGSVSTVLNPNNTIYLEIDGFATGYNRYFLAPANTWMCDTLTAQDLDKAMQKAVQQRADRQEVENTHEALSKEFTHISNDLQR